MLFYFFFLQAAAARNKLAQVPGGERKPHKSKLTHQSLTQSEIFKNVPLFLKKYSKFWKSTILNSLAFSIHSEHTSLILSVQTTHANGILAKRLEKSILGTIINNKIQMLSGAGSKAIKLK